jgi:hypothetical protein
MGRAGSEWRRTSKENGIKLVIYQSDYQSVEIFRIVTFFCPTSWCSIHPLIVPFYGAFVHIEF